MTIRLKCSIREDRIRGGITWLEVEEADGGYYLFQYDDIGKPPRWDSFYGGIEELFRDCSETWGIRESDWQKVD